MSADHDELERLFAEAEADAGARAALKEAHRQLEKDLLRLADPLPPADFLQQVMKRVERAPAPVTRADVTLAVALVVAALVGAVWLAGASSLGSFGLAIAQAVVWVREGAVALGTVLSAVWKTAALPVAVAGMLMVMAAMVAVRRFAGAQLSQAKVTR